VEKSIDNSTWYQQRGANGAPLAEQAKQQAGQVMQQTKEAAGRAADQAVQQVKTQIETGKERATGSLAEVAQALHETGASLRERNLGAVGHYADTGAELVEQVSGYFRDRSVDQIVDDAESLARRQAGLFLGGAFAVGFILSRFFKSTSPYGSRQNGNGNGYGSSYARASGAMLPSTPPYSSEAINPTTTPGAAETSTASESQPYPGAAPISGER
jgi:hypothetical protein